MASSAKVRPSWILHHSVTVRLLDLRLSKPISFPGERFLSFMVSSIGLGDLVVLRSAVHPFANAADDFAIKAAADANGRSMNAQIVHCIEAVLGSDELRDDLALLKTDLAQSKAKMELAAQGAEHAIDRMTKLWNELDARLEAAAALDDVPST
jgi:hypothetical protein